ncbi:MAG: polyhydroxyalkanoic acid system family protein [Proteobacteria bacterium]|nr:polyhydroxyalkanoic acid system family protein [Pseudomonadota bacterium]
MVTHDIPHDLVPELARRAAQKAVQSYKEGLSKYDVQADWVSDDRVELSFAVKGKRLHGAMTVRPNDLHLELDVPLLFRPFSKLAIGVIEREAREWIDKAQAGQLE